MFKQRKPKSLDIQARIQTDNDYYDVTILMLNKDISERKTQVECILRVLQSFIKKLKICLAIPLTLENSANLCKDEWIKGFIESKNVKIKNTILTNKLLKLLEFVDEHLEDSILWSKYSTFLSEKDQSLVKSFTLLYNITEQRLPSSALSDLSKQKKLHKLNRNINSVEKSVTGYAEKLRKQKIVHLWNIAYKGSLIQKYEEDLAFQKWDNNLRIKQEIVRSSKNIRCLQELSYGIIKELETEAETKRRAYNNLLRENLMFERDARIEKKKLLFQLQTYIQKFDKNIGEKIKENLHLQEVYDEKRRLFDEFLLEYNSQEEEFNTIVHQKEKEDQLIFEQKLMVFMMSRAARVIQVYWRRYRRDQKKKSKRGKGKGKRK